MGTRWAALFYTATKFDLPPVQDALQAAVDEVDAQMSVWNPDSNLMRLNACPIGEWVEIPKRLMDVLSLALDIGRASGGAFDIAVGDAVAAWGFGPEAADQSLIRKALHTPRCAAHEALELDFDRVRARKRAPLVLDLNGIAKGYGVDRLAETLRAFGISSGLVGIDGEMRTLAFGPTSSHGPSQSRLPTTIAVRPFDPCVGECGCCHIRRLSALGSRRGPSPFAYDGPTPRCSSQRVACLRDSHRTNCAEADAGRPR